MTSPPEVNWLAKIDFTVWYDGLELVRYRAELDITPQKIAHGDIAALVAFLHSLYREREPPVDKLPAYLLKGFHLIGPR